MKRKRFGAYRWSSILRKRYKQQVFSREDFRGIVGLLYIDESTQDTFWELKGMPVEVCGKGMKWLQMMPEERNCVITAMISPENTINLFYIDMIGGGGLDEEDQIAYFDDLFLDLIIHPSGIFHVDDRNELDDAYAQGKITKELYEHALMTCENLQEQLSKHFDEFMEFCKRYLKEMESIPEFTPLPEKIYETSLHDMSLKHSNTTSI